MTSPHLDDLVRADRDLDGMADEEDDDDCDERDGGADRATLLLAQTSR